jgi:plasmid replication initiation protein
MNDEYKNRLRNLSRQLVDIFNQIRSLDTELTVGEVVVAPTTLQDALEAALAIVGHVEANAYLAKFVKARDLT